MSGEGTVRMFPVLWPYRKDEIASLESLGCPRKVPFAAVMAHEHQCLTNHGQSVQRLNDHGGLSPCELVAVLMDRGWRSMPDADAVKALIVLVGTLENEDGTATVRV